MTALSQIQLGAKSYFGSLRFLYNNGLMYVFAFPLVLSILLFALEFSLFEMAINPLEEMFHAQLKAIPRLNEFITGYGEWIWWIVSLLLHIIFFLFFSYTAGFIMLIILSPLLAWLSEQIESKARGVKFDASFAQIMADAFRGVRIAVRNMMLELSFALLLLFAGFIPVIGWFAPIVLYLVSSYYYGFSFLDYTNERHRRGVRESIMHIHMHKWLAISIGAGFALMMLIPWLGFILAGFAAILSTTAATLAMLAIQSPQNRYIVKQ